MLRILFVDVQELRAPPIEQMKPVSICDQHQIGQARHEIDDWRFSH
jgi:hypothetical protein